MSIRGTEALGWEGDGSARRAAPPRLAALQGELDRGRHQRSAAQHHRQARAAAARRLRTCIAWTLVLDRRTADAARHARSFVAEQRAGCAAAQAARHAGRASASSRQLWQQMAELGWAGVLIPEEHGGPGFGYVGAGLVLEEIGRTSTADAAACRRRCSAATRCLRGGNDAQKKRCLPGDRRRRPHASRWRRTRAAAPRAEQRRALRADRRQRQASSSPAEDLRARRPRRRLLIVAARTSGDAATATASRCSWSMPRRAASASSAR